MAIGTDFANSDMEDPSMFPTTVDRVRDVTSECVNERIRHSTQERICRVAAGGPRAIEEQLRWDIERCLEVLAPTLTLVGVGLALFRDKKWLALPAVIQAFFLQHALHGWCPPIPVLRELGVRTQGEIEQERYAIKALRGDFRHVKGQGSTSQALAASEH
jgi:hypothetical protein